MGIPVLARGEFQLSEALADSKDASAGCRLGHTMLRISDPEQSLKFYSDLLGMSLIFRWNTGPLTVYYLGYATPEDKTPMDISASMTSRSGLLELVQVHGNQAKSSADASSSHADVPTRAIGFGHLGFLVPKVDDFLERARKLGFTVLKKPEETSGAALDLPDDGSEDTFDQYFLSAYTQIGFVRDPDG
jgi:lactoylglutathione lyase